ncbi:MAG: hypothetical protein JXQ23_11380 [Clostridia bacterium]|nr:hypothetical protein [Clostridia bacterium]
MGTKNKKINVGIGFVTGRKNFKDVAKAYVKNWKQDSDEITKNISINLFVAYDLSYQKTLVSDYKNLDDEVLDIVDSAYYIGETVIANEADHLIAKKIVKKNEVNLIFGSGYAKKRNLILYFAIKNRMDYLIFLDDDEYPMAVMKLDNNMVWKGQDVLATHIRNLDKADITHGHHCGYISPLPYVEFNDQLSENEFRIFIESISNDIITWDSIKEKMQKGGITYADMDIINTEKTKVVKEIDGMKFISGGNLGFNLKNTDKIFPFYNPPGARGEDTFLSTSLGKTDVWKVPSYTFHDGFGAYKSLLEGVLPQNLKSIYHDYGKNTERFLKAAIGWIRYKPLLLYIIRRDSYEEEINEMRENLTLVLPRISTYFGNNAFNSLLKELEYYHSHVKKHFEEFKKTGEVWSKMLSYLKTI